MHLCHTQATKRPAPCLSVDEIEVEVARSDVPVETRPHVVLACHTGDVHKGTPNTRPRMSDKGVGRERGGGVVGLETLSRGKIYADQVQQ